MRQYVALLVLIGVSILQQGLCLFERTPRIAIIGGGIGGASASHFLNELFKNETLIIDLYEANTIGGRLATIEIKGDEVEAGGSIIHPKNMYMQEFVKLLGLEKGLPCKGNMGIWNGDEFTFIESDWFLVSLMKLLYRYGLQPFTLKRHIDDIVEDFTKIYDLQEAGQSFDNVTALLSAMNKDFPKLLQMSLREYLLHIGYTEKLIDELVQAGTVVNYGQQVDIQSFVGCISLATNNDMWYVKGGNKKVPEHLIYRNKNVKVVPSRVTKIRYLSDSYDSSHYEVTYINKDSTEPMASTYDIVIIATPLTRDQEFQIEFAGFPSNFVFSGDYQTTYATFLKAVLNPKYFGLQEALDSVLSCNPNKTKFNSVGIVNTVDGSIKSYPPVWKIFSKTRLETSLMQNMFSYIINIQEVAWKAYPRYSTKLNHDNFKLHDALYHVNAIEWAGSAMEMSAIAGRNVAILAFKDILWKKHNFMLVQKISKDSTKKLRMFEEL